MTQLDGLLDAIVSDPVAEDRWQVFADFLEEHDDSRRAELLRLHRKLLATCCEPDVHPERESWHSRTVELLGQGVKPCVPQRSVVLACGVEMTFSFIPPGPFLMGSPEDEEHRFQGEDHHQVTLTNGFWMGIYPVTQSQWQTVIGTNPSKFTFKGTDRPVEMVSWDDCQDFYKKLGEQTGQRFRFPTEAEWEWACRAGTTTPYYTGDGTAHGVEAMRRAGWCRTDNTTRGPKGTKPVGQFEPNSWGLFDMSGNVLEWCQDWYESYCAGQVVDPQGPETGTSRVSRGGAWWYAPRICRSACRAKWWPEEKLDTHGCRVVLSLG